MTARPTPVLDASGELEVCSLCGCRWQLPKWDQDKDECCAEPRDGSCMCHSEMYAAGERGETSNGIRNPVVVEGEEVIGWVEPFHRFRPCDLCSSSPDVHNTNRGVDYIGHEYR